jgi:vacuolar-type H+-ATPase subunit D/Vma8
MHEQQLTGRIGRYLIQGRLQTARRAVALLERKLRILLIEQEQAWQAAAAEAERRVTVLAMLGGKRAIRLAIPPGPARLSIDWVQVMGVRYPASVRTDAPAAPPVGSAAAAAKVTARTALVAAAEAAVAAAAAHTVDTEVAETRRRRHAIADRRIPQLEETLHALIQHLEEDERADTVRLRWAARQPEVRP